AQAMFCLGLLHDQTGDGPDDRRRALDLFRGAAERGFAPAQCMLGRYLARGLAGAADPAEARLWLHKAGQQGEKQAGVELAWLDRTESELMGAEG
ncbi:sel1 repeat family protein, partial [Nguyenibacter vanlangensis]|nr:sel1 repeat family protein [Nguyenibacter vanlangensis]